jgi:adenine/guanine phosphoribosyltransferase-like PRPP-binding protein
VLAIAFEIQANAHGTISGFVFGASGTMGHRTYVAAIAAVAAVGGAVGGAIFVTLRERRRRRNATVVHALERCSSQLLSDAMGRAGVPCAADNPPGAQAKFTTTSTDPATVANQAAYYAIKWHGDTRKTPRGEFVPFLFPQKAQDSAAPDALPFVDTLAFYRAPTLVTAFVRECLAFLQDSRATALVAYESRAFTFAAAVAAAANLPLVAVHKNRGRVAMAEHESTVSNASSMRNNVTVRLNWASISTHERVVIIDDVVNTGATIVAIYGLLKSTGVVTAGVFTLVDFAGRGGRVELPRDVPYRALASL